MHLLDVNVWLGLAFQRHVHHTAAAAWFRKAPGPCAFCRFTQAGFLRLATNPSVLGAAAVPLADAWRAYDSFLADPRVGSPTSRQELKPFGDRIRRAWRSRRRCGRTR